MKILLAIEDSQFAEAVIQTVISQFLPNDTHVFVLQVVDWSNFMPSPFPRGGEEAMYSVHQLESIIESETNKAHKLVTSAAERLRSAGFETSTSVREGDARKVIVDYAAEWGSDLVLVGSHGRKGVAHLVLGSVSEAVARYAHCSVEIVRLPKAQPL
jgi:nucleotide-binding universal stress UspA family protein